MSSLTDRLIACTHSKLPTLLVASLTFFLTLASTSLLFGQATYPNIDVNYPSDNSGGCNLLIRDTNDRFLEHFHSDHLYDYFTIHLGLFSSDFERYYFYKEAAEANIYMKDKNEYNADSAIFISSVFDQEHGLSKLKEIIGNAISAGAKWDLKSQTDFLATSPFQKIKRNIPSDLIKGEADTIRCSSASVSCSGNTYTFPASVSGFAPAASGNPPYPNYGCLGSEPFPVWYYMQVGQAGNIIIDISQTGGNDVDFICWGPFNSLSEGCSDGLTGTCPKPGQPCCNNNQVGCTNFYPRGNIVDCSYSGSANETCHILNAQVGEIYILLMTNFSQAVCTLSFSQTGGTGLTNCNIVEQCSMIALVTNATSCDPSTNRFSISGDIEFSNPPAAGNLTITDNTAIPPVSQVFTPPFTSPQTYNLSNIPCDGLIHTVIA